MDVKNQNIWKYFLMKTQDVQPLTAGGLICLNLGTYVQVINVTKQTYSSAMFVEINSVNILEFSSLWLGLIPMKKISKL